MRRITSVWDFAPPDLPEPVIPLLSDWLAPMADMSADDLTERELNESRRVTHVGNAALPKFADMKTIGCGAQQCAAHGLHRPTHERPAPATNRRADPALIQRPEQGSRERDGQERAGRLTVSLMGTWSALHRSGKQTEKATSPGHPAAAMTIPQYASVWNYAQGIAANA